VTPAVKLWLYFALLNESKSQILKNKKENHIEAYRPKRYTLKYQI
jgi:hypothetical protein